jgi:CBS domain-containing protein
MPTRTKRGARSTTRKTTRGKATARSRTGGRAKKAAATRRPTAARRTKPTTTQRVSDVMTPDPIALVETETVFDAAKMMRDDDIGDVIVLDDTSGRVKGIVTDRDMVVRAVAEGRDPSGTTIGAICSEQLVCVTPRDPVDKAVRLMRDKAIRRLPVVEDDRPVGVVSIGDLALELDKRSALAEISEAPPNT